MNQVGQVALHVLLIYRIVDAKVKEELQDLLEGGLVHVLRVVHLLDEAVNQELVDPQLPEDGLNAMQLQSMALLQHIDYTSHH